MLKYNFKKFFTDYSIHNDDWFSNGYFVINKSILTGTQKKVFDDNEKNEESINNFIEFVNKAKKVYEDTKEPQEFIPELVILYEKKEKFNIFYNRTIDLAIQERYYNFLTNRKCKLYKGERAIDPVVVIDNNSEVVGMVLPVRIDTTWLVSGVDYDDYIKQLEEEEQIKKAKRELKKGYITAI